MLHHLTYNLPTQKLEYNFEASEKLLLLVYFSFRKVEYYHIQVLINSPILTKQKQCFLQPMLFDVETFVYTVLSIEII